MDNMTESEFRGKITYLQFFLSILVVSIHTYNVVTYGLENRDDWFSLLVLHLEKFMNTLAGVCVPFFFVLSGYLFYRTFTLEKLGQKFKSRVRSLLVPYIIWCSLYFVFYAMITRVPFIASRMNMGVELTVRNYLQCIWHSTYTTLWFVRELMILVLFAPVIWVLLRNVSKNIYSGLLIFIVLLLCELGVIPVKVPYNNVFYFLGAYIGINHKELPLKRNFGMVVVGGVGLIIALIGIAVIPSFTYGSVEKNLLLIVSLWAVSSVFSFHKTPQWYYSISFFIYCIHSILLEALEKLWLIIGGTSTISALASYLLMPVLVTGIIIIIAGKLKKYAPGVWLILNGSRG